MFKDDDDVFVTAFSHDLCILGHTLQNKLQSMGIQDYQSF